MTDTVLLSALGYNITNGAISLNSETGQMIEVVAGDGDEVDENGVRSGGNIQLSAGSGSTAFEGSGGPVDIAAGVGAGAGQGGHVSLAGGSAQNGNGGTITIAAGDSTDGAGGDIEINAGNAFSSGTKGNVFIFALPTADPHVANALWNNAGTLKISAG